MLLTAIKLNINIDLNIFKFVTGKGCLIMYRFNVITNLFLLIILSCLINSQPVMAGSDAFTQKDRELLIRLDERLNQVDKRFEQIDKRFEQVDKRFEQIEIRISELREDMNKRFEQVDKRFDFMLQIMIAIVGAFVAIVAITIGFALWDRRTMIRPFETRVQEIENDIIKDRRRLEALIDLLKQQAKTDQKLASLLKSFSLL